MNQLSKESLEEAIEAIETIKNGKNKIPLSMSPKILEGFKKLKHEEQQELLDLYNSIIS